MCIKRKLVVCMMFYISLSPLPIFGELNGVVKTQQVFLGNHGVIRLQVPCRWKFSEPARPYRYYKEMKFTNQHKDDFLLLMTIYLPKSVKFDPNFNSKSRIRYHISLDRNYLTTGTDVEAPLVEIKGRRSEGYYFAITDNKKASITYRTIGAIGMGKILIRFTVLSGENTRNDKEKALNVIRSIRLMARG